jgi:predicted nucleic acid-binding protein
MILVDASVIFDHTRGKDPRLAQLFKALPVAVCGVIRAEVLHGARNAKDRAALLGLLNRFAQVPTPESVWDALGDHLCTLRTHGVTVPLPDALLATVAIIHGLDLWTRDAHFGLIQGVLTALQLFPEPP